ncbi:MAG: cyclic nucleotide-binding domain-containing protein [Limisphaerales bacterium]
MQAIQGGAPNGASGARSPKFKGELFVLLEGAIEIRVGDRVVETANAGALLGEMALINESPRTATAATSACRLAKVDARRFHFLIQQNPFFATHVMRVLVARLQRMNQLVDQPSA